MENALWLCSTNTSNRGIIPSGAKPTIRHASKTQVNQKVYASKVSDFLVEGKTFEVDGKSKNKKQIAQTKDAFVVKDDIEYGYENIIPLWHFGMNY